MDDNKVKQVNQKELEKIPKKKLPGDSNVNENKEIKILEKRIAQKLRHLNIKLGKIFLISYIIILIVMYILIKKFHYTGKI